MAEKFLRNEIILVKPVEENVATWIEEGRDGYLRWEGTHMTYDVPLTKNGIKKILSKEEQAFLEKEIDGTKREGWLSPYVKGDNFWKGRHRIKVEIPAKGMELDMNDPLDYIKRLILLANTEDIAPSFAQRLDRKYKFYLESKDNIEKTKSDKVDRQLRAMDFITKIKDDRDKMRNILIVLHSGKTGVVSPTISVEGCRNMLMDYVSSNLNAFLRTIEDKELNYKILYYKAFEKGAFKQEGYQLRAAYSGGKLIGETIEDGIKYIKDMAEDEKRQGEYATFKERLKK